MLRSITVALAGLAISACGGGSGETGSNSATASADATSVFYASAKQGGGNPKPGSGTPLPPGTQLIEYYGDSTIYGVNGAAPDARVAVPAPETFRANLPGNGTTYIVNNEGVNGSTACGLLRGNDGVHPKWEVQMANSQATYVLVNHAINDRWESTLKNYKSCLRSLAGIAKSYGKKIVFETPNPTRDSYTAGLEDWAQAMKDVAAEPAINIPVIDQHSYLWNTYIKTPSRLTAYVPDGLHPNQSTYDLKGNYAAQQFSGFFHLAP